MSVHQRDSHGDPPPSGTKEQTAEEHTTDPRPSHSSVRRRRAVIATILTAFGTAFIVAVATGAGGDAYRWLKPRVLGTPTQPPYATPTPTPTAQPPTPTSTPTTSASTTSASTTSAPTTSAFTATAPRTPIPRTPNPTHSATTPSVTPSGAPPRRPAPTTARARFLNPGDGSSINLCPTVNGEAPPPTEGASYYLIVRY